MRHELNAIYLPCKDVMLHKNIDSKYLKSVITISSTYTNY